MLTFDHAKRQANLVKHGIDLAELESAFDLPMVSKDDDSEAYGELRIKSLAWWRGRVVVMVWTERDSGAHVISCRYADKNQTSEYLRIAIA